MAKDRTNLTVVNVAAYSTFAETLKSFTGIPGKYKSDLDWHEEQAEPVGNILGTVIGGLYVETRSGLRVNPVPLQMLEQEHNLEPAIQDSLNLTDKMLSDQKLMEKEPALKTYLRYYQMIQSQGLSDKIDANNCYSDEVRGATQVLFDQFIEIPTAEKMEQLKKDDPAAYEAGRRALDFMDAVVDLYTQQNQSEKVRADELSGVDPIADLKETDERLEKVQEAAERFAEVDKKDLMAFYKSTGKPAINFEQAFGDLYGKKKNPQTAAKQVEERRQQIRSGMTLEEARILEGISSEIKAEIGNLFGSGAEIKNMYEPYRTEAQKIADLGKECKEKLGTGFATTEEKDAFFRKIADTAKNYAEKSAQKPAFPAPKDAEEKELQNFTIDFVREFRKLSELDNGAIASAVRYDERQQAAQKARDKQFSEKLADYYDMMLETGSGYFGHSNSKAYTEMMDTIKAVKDLGQKQDLNEMEKKRLGESYQKLSEQCTKYLDTKDKLSKQGTDTGKDRFAGAMGILNLVDPVKAEELRQKASDKRKVKIRWEELDERTENSAAKRRQAAAERRRKEAKKAAPDKDDVLENNKAISRKK